MNKLICSGKFDCNHSSTCRHAKTHEYNSEYYVKCYRGAKCQAATDIDYVLDRMIDDI